MPGSPLCVLFASAVALPYPCFHQSAGSGSSNAGGSPHKLGGGTTRGCRAACQRFVNRRNSAANPIAAKRDSSIDNMIASGDHCRSNNRTPVRSAIACAVATTTSRTNGSASGTPFNARKMTVDRATTRAHAPCDAPSSTSIALY